MSARLTAVSAALLLVAATAAADPTVSSVKFGGQLMGKVPSADDLKGKVVVVEYWGIN